MKLRSSKNILFIALATTFLSTTKIYAQETKTPDFTPKGTVIGLTYIDYGVIAQKNAPTVQGFNIGRAFLGYNYKFTPDWQAQVILDGANYQTPNSDGSYSTNVYVRNAFAKWNKDNLAISFGVLGLVEFAFQETYWGGRYLERVHIDLNGMGPSVDLGAMAEYTISPKFRIDAAITNGDGIRKIQRTGSARYAVGVNYFPIEGMTFRVYGDMYNKSDLVMNQWSESLKKFTIDQNVQMARDNKYITALFLGYKNSKFAVGAEYNYLYNFGLFKGLNYGGYSIYGSYNVADKWRVYGRYDNTTSKNIDNFNDKWNIANDGGYAMFGVEYQPNKNIRISPNYRTSSRNNVNGKFNNQFFTSVEIKL